MTRISAPRQLWRRAILGNVRQALAVDRGLHVEILSAIKVMLAL